MRFRPQLTQSILLGLFYFSLLQTVARAQVPAEAPIGALLPQAAHPPLPPPRKWSLALQTGLPEVYGLYVHHRLSPWWGWSAHYAFPTPIRVKVEMESKTLLKKEGFAIKSPELVLPVDIDFGPHAGLTAEVFPFQGSFFLALGLKRRIVTIRSRAESQLIFVDPQGQTLSNSVIDAAISSRTQQTLLELRLGQQLRWREDRFFLSWFLGLTQPTSAGSHIETQLSVRNPAASDPDEVLAENIAVAEREQEKNLRDKAYRSLRDFERMTLPLLGLEVGVSF